MIWSEFQESVRTLLTVDAQRKGAGIQNYIDSIILSGVIELQQYIPSLRSMNRDTFYYDQLKPSKHIEMQGIQQGFTNGRSKITKAVVLKPQGESVIAIELNRWPWEKRNSLSMECLSDCRSARFPGKIMDCKRHNNSFYLYPSLSEDELLVLDWEGVKTNFTENDETPYDHRVIKVISDYAKAHIVREVDKDLQLYKEYYGMYIKERSVLFLDEKDSTLFDLPTISEDYYSTCCIKSDTLSRLVSPPEPPEFIEVITAPYYKPSGLTYAFVTSAPTGLSIPNARKTLYHSNAISNSDVQIPQIPTNLQFFQSNADGTELAPTNLQFYVGVATPPSDLSASVKPASPKNLRTYVATAPAAPTILAFGGLVSSAPTDLGAYPTAPSRLTGHQTFADSPPVAPTLLGAFPVSPTGLDFTFTNASGTIDFPFPPDELEAVHDGCAESTPSSYDIDFDQYILMLFAQPSLIDRTFYDHSTPVHSDDIGDFDENDNDTFPQFTFDVAGMVAKFKEENQINYGSAIEDYFTSWGSSARAFPRIPRMPAAHLPPNPSYGLSDESGNSIEIDEEIFIVYDPNEITFNTALNSPDEQGFGTPRTYITRNLSSPHYSDIADRRNFNETGLSDWKTGSFPDTPLEQNTQAYSGLESLMIGGEIVNVTNVVNFNGSEYVPFGFWNRDGDEVYGGIIVLVPHKYLPNSVGIYPSGHILGNNQGLGNYLVIGDEGIDSDISGASVISGGCIQGGGWIPESPSSLVAEVQEQAPPAPTGLEQSNLYLVWRYEFDGTNFVRKEFTLMDIDAEDGGTGTIEQY